MTLHTICVACIIIGIGIPFCSIVLNLFDGFADFVTIDLFHLDFGGDFYIDFLPLSLNSLCLWALIFGAIGLIFEDRLSLLVVVIVGLVAGYAGAVVLQSMISKLKKIENFAVDQDEILLREGIVEHAIPKGGMGSVSIVTNSGSNVTYPAKSFDGQPIEQNKEVSIVELHKNYLIVKSKTFLEEKYEEKDEDLKQEEEEKLDKKDPT